MNVITFTATISVREDCENMTDEELLEFAKYNLLHNTVVDVNSITLEKGY